MGGKSSNSQSSSTTNQYDQRQVHSTDSHAVTYDWDYTTNTSVTDASQRTYNDSHNLSTQVSATDNSQREYTDSGHNYTDNRNLSATDSSSRVYTDSRATTDSHNYSDSSTYTVNNADAAAIAKTNAEFLRGASENQSDALKAVAQMGLQGLDHIGGAFTDISTVASNNAAKAWTHTLDTSADLLGRVVDAANKNTDSARALASSAMSTYQPADSKVGDAMKYGLIAAAAVAAIALMKR